MALFVSPFHVAPPRGIRNSRWVSGINAFSTASCWCVCAVSLPCSLGRSDKIFKKKNFGKGEQIFFYCRHGGCVVVTNLKKKILAQKSFYSLIFIL